MSKISILCACSIISVSCLSAATQLITPAGNASPTAPATLKAPTTPSAPVAPAVPVTPAAQTKPAAPTAPVAPTTPTAPTTPATTQVAPKKNRAAEILDLWFGELDGPDSYPTDKAQAWFLKSPDNQREMTELFGADVMSAVRGDYNGWRAIPQARLALILLLDQIPRNIYIDKPQAFASDRMAQGIVLEGIQNGDDLKLLPIERAFFYLPLLHAEDPKLQDLSLSKYQELVNEATTVNRPYLQEFLTYAQIQRNIFNKFGRFPSRNAAYGRISTPEETAFLKE